MDERQDDTRYAVVVNHEEQYSIWPLGRDVPDGWQTVGKEGPKDECLKHIKEIWTDMRPLSLRRRMATDRHTNELTHPHADSSKNEESATPSH